MTTYGDVCQGYMQDYAADGWGWGGTYHWSGAEYDQLPAQNYASWDYSSAGQQQQQQNWEASVPHAGAELLTDLWLTKLKRLIDNDAQELRGHSGASGADMESDRSADCTTHTPLTSEFTSSSAAGGSGVSTTSATAAAEAAAVVVPRKASAVAAPSSGQLCGDRGGDRQAAPRLEVPEEKVFMALGDFHPESRQHGEMPISTGETVLVSGEVRDGWIFGTKLDEAGNTLDEGWLPASALDMEDGDLAFADQLLQEDRQPEAQTNNEAAPDSRRARARRSGGQHADAAGYPVANGTSSPGNRKGGRQGQAAVPVKDSAHADTDSTAAEKELDPMLNHVFWWSKQGHLKKQKQQEEARVQFNPRPQQKQQQQQQKQQPRAPEPQQHHQQYHKGGQQKQPHQQQKGGKGVANRPAACGGKPKGGGRGGSTASASKGVASATTVPTAPRAPPAWGRPMRDRPVRERPALTSLLDRLNKPLEAPKKK